MEKKENNYQILKYWTQNPVQISYIYNFFETYTKMRLTVYVLSSALSTAKDSESFKIVSENILNTSFPPSWEKKILLTRSWQFCQQQGCHHQNISSELLKDPSGQGTLPSLQFAFSSY